MLLRDAFYSPSNLRTWVVFLILTPALASLYLIFFPTHSMKNAFLYSFLPFV